jgi:hypothetical protein
MRGFWMDCRHNRKLSRNGLRGHVLTFSRAGGRGRAKIKTGGGGVAEFFPKGTTPHEFDLDTVENICHQQGDMDCNTRR